MQLASLRCYCMDRCCCSRAWQRTTVATAATAAHSTAAQHDSFRAPVVSSFFFVDAMLETNKMRSGPAFAGSLSRTAGSTSMRNAPNRIYVPCAVDIARSCRSIVTDSRTPVRMRCSAYVVRYKVVKKQKLTKAGHLVTLAARQGTGAGKTRRANMHCASSIMN